MVSKVTGTSHSEFFTKTNTLRTAETPPSNVDIYEIQHRNDHSILSSWASHIRKHYCKDDEIDFLREGTGKSRSEYLIDLKFPSTSRGLGPAVKSGDFSEILVADYLQFIRNFWVPRVRYGDKAVRNESTKGSDVLAFAFSQENARNDTLVIYEVKSQFSGGRAGRRLQDAIDSSAEDHIRQSESLNFYKQKLKDQEGRETASKISRFQDPVGNPYKEIYGAAAVYNQQSFQHIVVNQTNVINHPNKSKLELVVFHGLHMMQLANRLYTLAAEEA